NPVGRRACRRGRPRSHRRGDDRRRRERRRGLMRWQLYAAAVALLVAMAAGSLLILAFGQSPAAVYGAMLAATWGDGYGFGQVLFKSTPLIFTGLAVALAFRAGLFNIGAEGQLTVGAFATALAGMAL